MTTPRTRAGASEAKKVAVYSRVAGPASEEAFNARLEATLSAAEKLGPVVAEFADRGVSGRVPLAMRPGGNRMLAAAASGQFDIVVVASMSTLSRQASDVIDLLRFLQSLRPPVRLISLAECLDSDAVSAAPAWSRLDSVKALSDLPVGGERNAR